MDKFSFKSFAFYLSISNYIVFLINSSINNSSSIKRIFMDKAISLYLVKIFLIVLFLPVVYYYSLSTKNFNPVLLLLSISVACFSILNLDFYFKGKEVNNFQKIQFLSSSIQISILIIGLCFKFSIILIFTLFSLNAMLFFIYIVLNYRFRFIFINKSLILKFVFSLFLINLLNLLYYNLDVIFSFYLKDPILFKDFFIWTRAFSLITVLATIFSEYFSNKIFISLKPNVLQTYFERTYIIGVFILFFFIVFLKISFKEQIIILPHFSILYSSYTNFYLAVIPISFIGPIFGFNLLHQKKQVQLLKLTLIGILVYLMVFIVSSGILNFNILNAIAFSFMISKFIIESAIIWLNYYYNIISLKLLMLLLVMIYLPLFLLLI
jgi:hypothetical protein